MTARVQASSSFRRRVFERLEAVQKREREKESERGAFFYPSLFYNLHKNSSLVSFFFEFCFFLSLSLLPSSLLSLVDFFCLSIFFSFSWETFTHRRRQMHKAREEKEREKKREKERVARRGSRTRAVGKGGGRGGGRRR